MRKISLICLFISSLTLAGVAQNKPAAFDPGAASKTLKDQAAKMGQALLQKDYKTFCHYLYPKLLKMVGGEDKMIQTLRQSMDQVKTQGIDITGITYEEAGKAFKVGEVWQSSITQHSTMKLPENKLKTTSTLIAFSSDNGRNWTFLDTNNKDIATIRKIVPDLSPSITIPPPQAPVQTAD